MYAQRGSGKRSSYYSDYTFGCWTDDGELLPVGKAYFGFTDEELKWLDRWVRGHTVERFGPVREVEKSLVLEVAFNSIHKSTRHKSGLAMRFPRDQPDPHRQAGARGRPHRDAAFTGNLKRARTALSLLLVRRGDLMLKALLAGAAALAVATSASAETYAIQAGRLIVDAAQPARGPFDGDRRERPVEPDRQRLHRSRRRHRGRPASRTVMPGMTDVHVHLTMNSGEPWYAATPKNIRSLIRRRLA